MLNWGQIRVMQQAGIAFGSHTLCHPAISRLESGAFAEELDGSKALIEERINEHIHHFAYPFGKLPDYDGTQNAVASCGYRTAATTNWGLNIPGTDLLGLRRVSIGEERRLSTFAMKLAQLFLSSENQLRADGVAFVAGKKAPSAVRS
jgi:peptidoglycan/xylan/chitin deacetylase (PgdA/CDA1 family)